MTIRPTIKSIARDLGISHMTVSRALANRDNVKEETRRAILEYARKVGYVKSAAAETMRGGSTRIIGLLLPNIVNEYYARLADRMASGCRRLNHHLIIHITGDDTDAERDAFEQLAQLQAAGIAFVPAPGSSLSDVTYPMARTVQLIRRQGDSSEGTFIGIDDATTIAEATRHLIESGCRKVAMVAGGRNLSTGRARQDAFLDGLRRAGAREEAGVIVDGKPSFDLGRTALLRMADDPDITGLVCGGFEISNGAVSAYMEQPESWRHGFRLIGYGDPLFYAWLDGGISTIDPPVAALADRALEVLLDDGPSPRAASSHVFGTELIDRSPGLRPKA